MAYSISPERNFLSNSTQKAKELTKYRCRNTIGMSTEKREINALATMGFLST
jgi:hypothetical protein